MRTFHIITLFFILTLFCCSVSISFYHSFFNCCSFVLLDTVLKRKNIETNFKTLSTFDIRLSCSINFRSLSSRRTTYFYLFLFYTYLDLFFALLANNILKLLHYHIYFVLLASMVLFYFL